MKIFSLGVTIGSQMFKGQLERARKLYNQRFEDLLEKATADLTEEDLKEIENDKAADS